MKKRENNPAKAIAVGAGQRADPPSPNLPGQIFPQHLATGFWPAVLLTGLVLLVYWPALRGGILWDDVAHLTRADLRSWAGLGRIWFELGATQQYYPILHSAFWLEHKLWGDALLGYHLVNVFLHAAGACLLVALLRRLRLPGAWLAGFIFALHPVQVESVAWITEQKNTLSLVFYLLAALAYLRFDQDRKGSAYGWATGFFVLALLTKTVTATLPAALLVVFWWQRGRLEWRRDVGPLLPWFVLGAAGGLFTAWVERTLIGAEGAAYNLDLLQRGLLAGRVVCFYLGKLFWPAELIFTYPRWTVDATVPWQWLFPLGLLALTAVLWSVRSRWRGPLAGLLIFGGSLFPVLGFFNVFPFIYSYVADHFQYLASLGIIVPVAAALTGALERTQQPWRRAGQLLLVLLVAGLAGLSWRQSRMYRDSETLYRTTLARNPTSWMAMNNLATIWHESGHKSAAILLVEEALRQNPAIPISHYNYGFFLLNVPGRLPESIAHLETALRLNPKYAKAHNGLGAALLKIPARRAEALAHFEAAVRLMPGLAFARFNLANALLRQPGRLADAIQNLGVLLQDQPDDAEVHNMLGEALLLAGRNREEARAHFETALRLRPDYRAARDNLAKLTPVRP